jgi:hypothetical protein
LGHALLNACPAGSFQKAHAHGEHMNEIIFMVEDADEGGYIARALGASIFTQADTLPELRAAVREAVHCHFDEGQVPSIIRLHFTREEVIAA